jgi:hypothetical protein
MCLNIYPLSRAFVAASASKTKEGARVVDFGAVIQARAWKRRIELKG